MNQEKCVNKKTNLKSKIKSNHDLKIESRNIGFGESDTPNTTIPLVRRNNLVSTTSYPISFEAKRVHRYRQPFLQRMLPRG